MRAMRRGAAPDIASLIRGYTFASLNPAAGPTGVKRLFALLTGVATFRHLPCHRLAIGGDGSRKPSR